MNDIKKIKTPLDKSVLTSLRSGDRVLLTGTVFTARDASHRRLMELVDSGEPLPISLNGQILYYCGPTPASPGRCAGSAGPTTSSRMDRYAPALLRATGLAAMIGKGGRGASVVEAIRECGAAYFAATGGAGALISSCIKSSEIVCYDDLGPEAIYRFEVESMPLIVAVDARGYDLYKSGPQEYLESARAD